jgi:hypothetical protein
MADKVVVKIALQGDGVAVKEFDSGTTLAELKRILELNSTLEFRVSGEDVDDDFVVDDIPEDTPLIGTTNAKGGNA